MTKRSTYDGPVCYADGWHWTVVDGQPAEKLFLNDDGTYRLATDDDASWHDRKHERYVTTQMVPLDDEERAAIEEIRRRREEQS